MKRHLLLLLCGFYSFSSAATELLPNFQKLSTPFKAAPKLAEKEQPPALGNFSLPSSQQPGPLLAFGGNIIEQGQTQIALGAEILKGKHQARQTLTPSFVYGITDGFSIVMELPIATSYKDESFHSSSLADAVLQFESAFYNQANASYEEEATLVTGLTLPTGDKDAVPSTGLGATSFFLGATFTRTYVEWLWFATLGAQLPSKIDGVTVGKEFLYDVGVGKTFSILPAKWLLAWVLELDGTYMRKAAFESEEYGWEADPNSGGNVIFFTPSLFAASKNLAFQIGAGFPVVQKLYGEQRNNRYLLAANFTLTLS